MASCLLLHHTEVIPSIPQSVSDLLHNCDDIFEAPAALPPSRPAFDHIIPLKDYNVPLNLRPYRYSIAQKDMVGKLVNELLKHDIIQHNTNPYVSPRMLFKKKNGSWRLCVEYRRLNSSTLKGRLHIPLIEDLMDELGGATTFLNWT